MIERYKIKVPKGEACACCGTDLDYWFYEKKKKVYRIPSDDYLCSKKCLNDYCKPYAFEIIKNDN
jgi:hypothetical protein